MKIADIHVEVVQCRDAMGRAPDHVQRDQWWHVARRHLPNLIEERDACVRDLERWDRQFSPDLEPVPRAAREDWWIARLHELEAVYVSLETLGGMIPVPHVRTWG